MERTVLLVHTSYLRGVLAHLDSIIVPLVLVRYRSKLWTREFREWMQSNSINSSQEDIYNVGDRDYTGILRAEFELQHGARNDTRKD